MGSASNSSVPTNTDAVKIRGFNAGLDVALEQLELAVPPVDSRAHPPARDRRQRAHDRQHDDEQRHRDDDEPLDPGRNPERQVAVEDARPEAPVLGATPRLQTARRMAVIWGVHAVETPDVHSMTEMVSRACRVAVAEGIAKAGETIVVTAGTPFGTPGATNSLRIAQVP